MQLPFGDVEGLVAKDCLHSRLLMQSVSWSDRQLETAVGALVSASISPKGLCCHSQFILSYLVSAEGQDGIRQLAESLIIASQVFEQWY